MRLIVFILLLGFIILILSCTLNPFGSDEISSQYRRITGNVYLRDRTTPGGIYVWLDGFKVGTYTNENGEFNLGLPSKSSYGDESGLSGVYSLFFYCANYILDSAQVVVRNGEFVYSRGDINEDGRLAAPRELKRFLRIETVIEPNSIPTYYSDNIEVTVTLTATSDTVTVITPYAVPPMMGAVLLKKTDSDNVYSFTTIPYSTARVKLVIGPNPTDLPMSFNTLYTQLPVGEYDVIPYILVHHEPIPKDLLNSIGQSAQRLGPDYLKVPFKRIGGSFRVQ